MTKETAMGLKKGHFQFLGRARRTVDYRDKTVINFSLQEYLARSGITFQDHYRYCAANKPAELPSLAKYDRGQPVLNPAAWRESGRWMRRHFTCMRGASELEMRDTWAEMPQDSSAGWPHSIKYTNKRDMVRKCGDKWFDYLEEMKVRLEDPERIPPTFVWTSSVKAEMRPTEKAIENKLRTFTASPADHSTLLNMLCLDMNNKFYQMGKENTGWSCVGMSKYGRGWNALASRLLKHLTGWALDGSAFDSSVFRLSLEDICRMRCECLNATPQQKLVMERLYSQIIESVIITTSGDVVMKTTGNPSGSVNTVVDNTLHLYRLIAYAWILVAPVEMRTYESMHANVEAALYGDDNTFTVNELAQGFFNARSVERALAGILKMTAEDDCWEPRKLEELRFLNQGFKYSGKYYAWVPVPLYTKLMSSMMFASQIDDVRWHMMRARMLYIEGFWNEEFRGHISGYIQSLYRYYSIELAKSGEIAKGVTSDQVRGLERDDASIVALYLGIEESATKGVLSNGSEPLLNSSIEKLKRNLEVLESTIEIIDAEDRSTEVEAQGQEGAH